MLWAWGVVCWFVGHVENSETIVESVYVADEYGTHPVEHTSLVCNRCMRWL